MVHVVMVVMFLPGDPIMCRNMKQKDNVHMIHVAVNDRL